jgi:hypothetical protein
MNGLQPGVEPRPARANLLHVRLFVNPALPSRLPLEVFDHVGEIHATPFDVRLYQSFVEHSTCRADEGSPLDVLSVAGLLTNEHDLGGPRALSEHGLRAGLPQIACPAGGGSLSQRRQTATYRNQIACVG